MSDNAPANALTALEGMLSSHDEGVKLQAAQTIIDAHMGDRRLTLQESEAREEVNGKEIDRLARFLLDEFPQVGGPLGAVDTAIALIKNLRDQARNSPTD